MRPYGEQETQGRERGRISRVEHVKAHGSPYGRWEHALRIVDGHWIGHITSVTSRARLRRRMKKGARQAAQRELHEALVEIDETV